MTFKCCSKWQQKENHRYTPYIEWFESNHLISEAFNRKYWLNHKENQRQKAWISSWKGLMDFPTSMCMSLTAAASCRQAEASFSRGTRMDGNAPVPSSLSKQHSAPPVVFLYIVFSYCLLPDEVARVHRLSHKTREKFCETKSFCVVVVDKKMDRKNKIHFKIKLHYN